MKILEIACGGGLLLLEALNQGAAHVTGVDISETMLKSASEVLQNIDSSKYTLKCGDCTDSQTINSLLLNEKFDIIIGNWMLCYLTSYENLVSFLNICKSLLKPNGKVSFITCNQSLISHFEESTSKGFFNIYRFVPVNLESRPAETQVMFLDSDTGEETFRVKNFIFWTREVVQALSECGFDVIRNGPCELSPEIEQHGHSSENFRDFTEEIGVAYHYLAKLN